MVFDFGTAVENIEAVPEQFRSLYETSTTTNKVSLKANDPVVKGAVEAILGLNGALKKERDAKKATVDLSVLKDYGSTPDEIKTKIDELNEKISANAKINVKQIKDDIAGQFKGEIDKRELRIKSLKSTLDTHLIDSSLKSAIAAEGGDVELLLPFARSFMLPTESEAGYSVTVVDDKGNARYSGITAAPMTPLELVKEMKATAKFAKLFPSQSGSGSGARPGASAGAGSRAGEQQKEMTAMERISLGLAKRERAA